jgi:RNA polymerase sigma-70 factor (ECF subfamily)
LALEPPALSQPLETSDVVLAARGDAQAFRRLYNENVDRVHALARRMVGFDQVEELTQDVFVRAWQKLHTFRGESRFSTWLHRLAVNLILSRRASMATHRNRFIGDDEVLDRAESRPDGREHAKDLESAIARLPEGARMIFVLHDVEGYRHEEIAGLLGVTTGTTKAQLHRARMLLRGHLDA